VPGLKEEAFDPRAVGLAEAFIDEEEMTRGCMKGEMREEKHEPQTAARRRIGKNEQARHRFRGLPGLKRGGREV